MHKEKETKLPGLAETLFVHTKMFAPHQPHWCSAGTSLEHGAGGGKWLDMTADVHATLGGVGGTPPSQKSPKDCQMKSLTKQCASCVKIVHIFCYGKISTLCPSTLNDITETRLYQLISIPAATACGQQGTGLCKNLAVDLDWQTHSIFSPIHWTCCAAHTELWSIQPLPWGFLLFKVVVKQLLNLILYSW